ncbi:MAG: LapA family protein [candidate division Zixibacteria bacterium]|nr:LapA family protein [candidate division Zixibacteria bacterium]
MWAMRVLLLLVIIVLIVGFSIYNSAQRVAVHLVVSRYENVPLIVVTYWAFVLGMVVSFLLGIAYYLRITNQMREREKDNKRMSAELTALRNRPIDTPEEV